MKQVQLIFGIIAILQMFLFGPLIAEEHSSVSKDIPVYVAPNIVANNSLEINSFGEIGLRTMPIIKSVKGSTIPPRYKTMSSPASVTYYSDRSAFISNYNNMFIEDFEKTLVPDLGIVALPGPWDSSTNNSCFPLGGIVDGIRFSSTPFGDLVSIGDGAFTPTAVIGPNTFVDNFDISLLNETYAIGFDIFLPFGSTTYDIHVHGVGDALIDVVSVVPSPKGIFWGVSANQPITRIRLDDRGFAGAELIDNVLFGPTVQYVKVSGNITWGSSQDPIPGINVKFSNGGPTVSTNSNGYYEAFMVRPYSGTATPSSGNINFTPENIEYVNIVSKQENQNFKGQPNIVEVSGTLSDANNTPIPDVTLTFDDGFGKMLVKTDATISTITDANGKFIIYLPLYWSGTITPSKTDVVFEPSSYNFSISDTRQSDLIFTSTLSTLDIEDYLDAHPISLTVLPAYPNPFNPSTTITYGLDEESEVSISIYDISGKLITSLINSEQQQGWYSTVWNGTDYNNNQVPAGIYLGKVTSNENTKTIKLMLLK